MFKRNRGYRKAGRILRLPRLQSLEPRILLAATGGPEFVPGELLVQYASGLTTADRDSARGDLGMLVAETVHTTAMQSAGTGPLERLVLPDGLPME
ncbi:MAG: LEPR-XLL domain-containing protein, partial [Planctomycetaceae bacterium]